MREYDLIVIVHPDLEENALSELLEKVKGWITEAGGAITKADHWGKRKLAYPIRKQRDGQFVLLKVNMPPTFGAALERNLRFAEPVLRFMLTQAA